MKQRIFGLLAAAVFATAAVPQAGALSDFEDRRVQPDGTFCMGWNQSSSGTFELQDHPDGSITGSWDVFFNCCYQDGIDYAGNEPKIGQLAALDVSYEAEISAEQGVVYYGVNGEYRPEDPSAGDYSEFYVIEGWQGYRPPGANAELRGTAEINGVQYDLYITARITGGINPKPPIMQYWSVRHENAYAAGAACSGTVSLLEHIRAWDAIDGTDTWQDRTLRKVYFESASWAGEDNAAAGSCEIAAPEISLRYAGSETLTGDANGDGTVDISDAVLVMRYAVEDREAAVTEQGIRNADVDKNGKTDESDATMILKYIAKKITF